jgi:hypothetical protein
MNAQFEAAWAIHQLLVARGVPYAIIGGVALQYWGDPRVTLDLDVTVLPSQGREAEVASALVASFAPRIPDAVAFAAQQRILLLRSVSGCPVDVSFGLPGYEESVIARAATVDLGDGRSVRVCSAEDLIIHKAVAGRPQDLMDIEGIIARQRDRLDLAYLRQWFSEFSRLLEGDEVAQRFERPWAEFQKRTS